MVAGTHRAPERAPVRGSATPGDLRLDVQGLRAVAVLAVVADHAGWGAFSGGYVGVDVFFVLSGFLITGLLVREADRDGRIRLGAFYARRARRILPAATAVLVAVVAFTALALSYRAVERVTTDAGWAAAFLANVHFSAIGTDYFAQGLPPSPVQHYWSLSVEEQFYLVWPPLLALLLLLHRRRAGDRPEAGPSPWRLVATVAGALCLASLLWSVALTGDDPTAAYFSSLARAWELGAGMLLALVASRLRSLGRWTRQLLAAGGLAAVVVAAVAYDAATPFPGYHALLPVLGTVAMVAAGCTPGPTAVGRLLSLRPLTWIGDLSYSIYLWHWPVLVLWAARTGDHRGALETAALLLVVLALSAASYHLVENPIRRGRWWRGSHLRGLVLWPLALGLVVVAVLGGRDLAGARLDARLQESQRYAALRHEDVPVRQELEQALRLADQDAPVAFPLDDLDQVDDLATDLWNYEYSCWVTRDHSVARICPIGDTGADRTIVVLGDSHAGQWLPAFDALGRDHGYRVVPLIKYGCLPYEVPQLLGNGSRAYTECADFKAWALQEIPRLDPTVVYVAARALPPSMDVPEDRQRAVWSAGVRSYVTKLRAAVPDVRLVGDVSPLDFDPIDCLTDTSATMASCTDEESSEVRVANRLTARAARAAGAAYLDVTPLVCLDGRCPGFAGGRMTHANADHLSVDWVRHVLPELERLPGAAPPA
jgi:peptidoglycan/LPS O-acetylase OafA/YrhL